MIASVLSASLAAGLRLARRLLAWRGHREDGIFAGLMEELAAEEVPPPGPAPTRRRDRRAATTTLVAGGATWQPAGDCL